MPAITNMRFISDVQDRFHFAVQDVEVGLALFMMSSTFVKRCDICIYASEIVGVRVHSTFGLVPLNSYRVIGFKRALLRLQDLRRQP